MQGNSRREQALTFLFIGAIAFLFIFQARVIISPHQSVSFRIDQMNLAYGYGESSSSSSSSEPTCGNGTKAGDEGCDDGNANSGDGCSASCIVESGWSCTGTTPSVCSATSSSSSSSSTPTCGNGTKAVDEGCDDGDTSSGDGCSASCTVESGWSCVGTTPSTCSEVCGNGVKTAGEGCDDGDTSSGDGCSATCTVESGWSCTGTTPTACAEVCGNGVVTDSEECDDGNTSNGDGCTSACALQLGWSCTGTPSSCSATCGDGIVAGPESCDDGNATDTDTCRNTCVFASCGDSIVQANGLDGIPGNTDDESCDEGGETATCNDTCTSVACGDQNINQAAGETCDDGNASNVDACLNSCVSASCGDSYIRAAIEECDPPGVGTCSSSCKEASGISGGSSQQEPIVSIVTRKAPSPFCGNAVTQPDKDEECDEGRFNGLSPLCDRWCKASYCGDGLVQAPKEECEPVLQDDGTYAAQMCGGRTCTVPICTDNEDCFGGCLWSFLPACRVETSTNSSSFEIPKRIAASDKSSDDVVASPAIQEREIPEPPFIPPATNPSFFEPDSKASSVELSTVVIDPPFALPVFSFNTQESSNIIDSMLVECGNGIREAGEQCDDGIRNSDALPDSCRMGCIRSFCGDRVTDYSEECDDGNDILGDGCTPLCTQSTCGNNTLEPGEECDDGVRNSDTTPDSCSSRCLLPRCGDGLLDAFFGEACDQGEDNSNSIPDRCRLNCRRPYCGDGIKDADELCDDGNASNFDFCANTCVIVGCGNGAIEHNEMCDDGNIVAGDGCSAACILEKKSFIQWLNNAIRLPFQW